MIERYRTTALVLSLAFAARLTGSSGACAQADEIPAATDSAEVSPVSGVDGSKTLTELSDALRALRARGGGRAAGGLPGFQPDELDLRAELQASRGDIVGAIETQSRAIEQRGGTVDRYLTLGRLEAERGNLKVAADHFMRACTLQGAAVDQQDPDHALRPLDVDRARRLVARIRADDPNDTALRSLQIEVLLRAALPWQAAAIASEGARGEAPAERHLDLALTWRATGRPDSCRFALFAVDSLPEAELLRALLDLDAGRQPRQTEFEETERLDWAPPAAWDAVPLYLSSLNAGSNRLLQDHERFAEKWPEDAGGTVGAAFAMVFANLGSTFTEERIRRMGPYGHLVEAVEALHWHAHKTAWRALSAWVHAKRSKSPGQGRIAQMSPFLNPSLLARFLAERFSDDLEALRILARGFEDAGEWAAEDVFLRRLDFTRKSPERRMRARWHLRRFESAASLDVLGVAPRLLARDAASLRGEAWLQLGDPQRALSAIEQPGGEQDPLAARVKLRALMAISDMEGAEEMADEFGLCRESSAIEAGLACVELHDARGDQHATVELARRLVARQPNAPEPLLFLSRLERRAGSPRRALLAADRALSIAPQSPRVHFARGRALEQLGTDARVSRLPRQAEALAAFRAASQLAPDFKEARLALARRLGPSHPHEVRLLLSGVEETGVSEDLLLRARAESVLGHEESAIAAFAIVEARGELTTSARREYAELLRGSGERYDAIRIITPLLQNQEEWEARQEAARDLLALGRSDQAIVLFEEAIDTAPDQLSLRREYIEALTAVGNTRGALRAAHATTEVFPDSSSAWIACLEAAEVADDQESIIRASGRLVSLRPGSPDRGYWEGWVQLGRGRLLATRLELENARRSSVSKERMARLTKVIADRAEAVGGEAPHGTRAARGFLAQADTVGALSALSQSLAADPSDSDARILVGEIHIRRNEATKALATISPLINASIVDVDPRALRVAGLAHNLLGNLVEAEIAFELAIAMGIIDPEVHFRLALLRVMRGDMGTAAEDLGGFLDESPGSPFADQALDLYLRLGGQ